MLLVALAAEHLVEETAELGVDEGQEGEEGDEVAHFDGIVREHAKRKEQQSDRIILKPDCELKMRHVLDFEVGSMRPCCPLDCWGPLIDKRSCTG